MKNDKHEHDKLNDVNVIYRPDNVYTYRYEQIKETFERLFRKHALLPVNLFDKDVWFMKDDPQYQMLIRPTSASTPTPCDNNNKMLNLLAELSMGGYDMKKLRVQVAKFLERICEILVKAQQIINRSHQQLVESKAYENVSVLEIKILDLNKKLREKTAKSKLNIKIGTINYFPEGNYSFKFQYVEMNSNVIKSTKNVSINLIKNKILKITEAGRLIVLNDDPQNDCKFEECVFYAIEVDENSSSLQDFTYSGTTLSAFRLQIYRDEILFAQSEFENFVEMFLFHIDRLKDINNSQFNLNWNVKCKLNSDLNGRQITFPINNLLEGYDVNLDCNFDFDPITLGSIFFRIMYIYKDVIQTKTKNQNIIEEILEYFKPVKEEIKHILEKPLEIQIEEKCCACSIY